MTSLQRGLIRVLRAGAIRVLCVGAIRVLCVGAIRVLRVGAECGREGEDMSHGFAGKRIMVRIPIRVCD